MDGFGRRGSRRKNYAAKDAKRTIADGAVIFERLRPVNVMLMDTFEVSECTFKFDGQHYKYISKDAQGTTRSTPGKPPVPARPAQRDQQSS